MDLKKVLPKKEKKDKSELLWSLIIEPEWIQAGIWKVEDEKAHIVASSNPAAWELEDELISTTDAALSSAVQNLPEVDNEPSKTVFGVVSSWVKKGEIKDDYLEKIKKICSKLSLKPVGFVVIPEAIAHFVKSNEGAPLNAVILGISKENIEMSVFKLGNLTGTSEIARSVSAFDDVTEGLTRFADGDFPTRFILYDGKEGELEDIRQTLLKANWDDLEKIKFLHTPKIEILSPSEKIQAVSLAGASEMGSVKSVKIEKPTPPDVLEDVDSDIESKEDIENIADPEKKLSAEDLGFAIGSDISEIKPKHAPETVETQEEEKKEATETKQTSEVEEKRSHSKKANYFAFLSKLKLKKPKTLMLGKIGTRLGSIFARKALVVGVGFFIAILMAGVVSWWFFPKAKVTVYLTTKQLDERITITIDPESDNTQDNTVILGSTISTEISGDDTSSTTGTKVVGEKATGTVTFYRVGPSLTLSAGTEIEGPSGLTYSLDESLTLASGSAGSAGETAASVTASDLGAQYNLVAGTTFSVSNYSTSDIEARNDSAFTGGSSREINAVSEDDLTELEEALKKELMEKAKEELSASVTTEDFFIEDSLTIEVVKKDFNHKEGDEANTLALNMSVNAKALIVDRSSLTEIAMNSLKDRVPDGFVLRSQQINMEFEVEDQDDDKYELKTYVEANLLPEVDPNDLAKKIRGKYPTLAENYFTKEIPGFVRAEIILKPKLPGRLGTLPHVLNNIEVEIAAER